MTRMFLISTFMLSMTEPVDEGLNVLVIFPRKIAIEVVIAAEATAKKVPMTTIAFYPGVAYLKNLKKLISFCYGGY